MGTVKKITLYIWHICSRVERDISNAVIQSWKQKEYWNSYLWLQLLKEKSEGAIKLSIILYCLLILIFLVLVKIGPKQDLVGFLNGKLFIIKMLREKILKIERRKRNFSSISWKSRGERDMKISFCDPREKNFSHFSSRISRDRDSCQCLRWVSQWPRPTGSRGSWARPAHFVIEVLSSSLVI